MDGELAARGYEARITKTRITKTRITSARITSARIAKARIAKARPPQPAAGPGHMNRIREWVKSRAVEWWRDWPTAAGRAWRHEPDVDLFRAAAAEGGACPESTPWRRHRLDRLAYTVFDTETTGLNPARGHRIISIGAVRIADGRLLRHETYEQLVDPGRRVSRASRRIHGINDAMLAGQPRLGAVLPAFARFATGSVLVGHNIAFDLTFLELADADSGVGFTHLPVLDTLLLSSVVNPGHRDHSLDAIAARLGISVLGRHTALGDAILTGEIFVRLVALLTEKGISTLGEAQDAARTTYQARAGNTLF